MTDKKELLHQELLNKFDGELPEHLQTLFGDLNEEELELFLEENEMPFKENHHHKDYMMELKNNPYYVKLLEAYLNDRDSLTDKQIQTAQLVEKVLKRVEKHPDFYDEREGEMKKLPQEKQVALNQKIRKKTNEVLSVYKGLDVEDALELSLTEDTLPKPENTLK